MFALLLRHNNLVFYFNYSQIKEMMTNQIALIIIDVQKAFQLPDWGERNNILLKKT